MITYYTEEEFGDVLFKRIAEAAIEMKANVEKDLTLISFNNGELEYALKGKKILKTKRDQAGFCIVYPAEK